MCCVLSVCECGWVGACVVGCRQWQYSPPNRTCVEVGEPSPRHGASLDRGHVHPLLHGRHCATEKSARDGLREGVDRTRRDVHDVEDHRWAGRWEDERGEGAGREERNERRRTGGVEQAK